MLTRRSHTLHAAISLRYTVSVITNDSDEVPDRACGLWRSHVRARRTAGAGRPSTAMRYVLFNKLVRKPIRSASAETARRRRFHTASARSVLAAYQSVGPQTATISYTRVRAEAIRNRPTFFRHRVCTRCVLSYADTNTAFRPGPRVCGKRRITPVRRQTKVGRRRSARKNVRSFLATRFEPLKFENIRNRSSPSQAVSSRGGSRRRRNSLYVGRVNVAPAAAGRKRPGDGYSA